MEKTQKEIRVYLVDNNGQTNLINYFPYFFIPLNKEETHYARHNLYMENGVYKIYKEIPDNSTKPIAYYPSSKVIIQIENVQYDEYDRPIRNKVLSAN